MKGYKIIEEKGYATTGRAQRWNFPRSEKTDPVNKRMEYMSFAGTITMFLRVVAPQTPEMIDGF